MEENGCPPPRVRQALPVHKYARKHTNHHKIVFCSQKKANMKISVPLLFSIAYSAPGPNQEPEYLDSGERSLDTACSDLGDEFIIVAQDNAYNGQSGKLTLNKQSNYMPKGFVSIIGSCSEQIGQQCKYGVGIKWNMTFPTGLYNGYAPYILIAVYYDTESGEMKYTERYYGENNKYTQYNLPREFEIPNTNNVRIYIYGNKTQYSLHALAEIEWECLNYDPEFPMSNIVATNTWQMANAVLTNGFTPQMAEDYGCTGRGLFDAYGPTIGPATDYIDTAFLTWKKCVKCASSENEDNIVPYWYDATSDSCGDNIGKFN